VVCALGAGTAAASVSFSNCDVRVLLTELNFELQKAVTVLSSLSNHPGVRSRWSAVRGCLGEYLTVNLNRCSTIYAF
jgi:hypothetical protein